MALELLDPSLQNIVLYNFDAFGKMLLLVFLIGLSAYYLFYHRKYVEQETIYFNVYILRQIFFMFSTAIIVFLLPFAIFFISPEYTLKQFYSIFMILWIVSTSIWLIVFSVDFFRYGFLGTAALGGLKVDKNSQEFARRIKRAKFFKYKF